jgi:hypothetical protein
MCQYCGKEFDSGQALGGHVIWCDENPDAYGEEEHERRTEQRYGSLEEFTITCDSNKCDEEFTVEEREKQFPKKDNYFCCNSCARSFSTQGKREEINKKVSEVLKGGSLSEDHIVNSGDFSVWDYMEEGRKLEVKKNIIQANTSSDTVGQTLTCPVCRERWVISGKGRKYCSMECYVLSPQFGNGEGGTYNGDPYHSSWELAFAVYHEDHNIQFERIVGKRFSYNWQGEEKYYVPDFKYHGEHYVEVKGYKIAKDQAKWDHFPHKLEVLRWKEMQPILKYVRSTYGERFWEDLYD